MAQNFISLVDSQSPPFSLFSDASKSVQIVVTNMFPAFSYPGNLFRQNFFNLGYLAEIDTKYELLKNYFVFLSNT